MRQKVELGDEVEDKVSGFKGIAVAAHVYMFGCERISVQPSIGKDRKKLESECFDEPQLKIIKRAKVKKVDVQGEEPGGTDKYVDAGRGI